jgi:hypothetical protein
MHQDKHENHKSRCIVGEQWMCHFKGFILSSTTYYMHKNVLMGHMQIRYLRCEAALLE